MNAVDTNILFYALDPRDPRKKAIADSLIRAIPDGVLLWQVAVEFLSASRKLQPYGFNPEHAWQHVRRLSRIWANLPPDWSALERAEEISGRYLPSTWDALLVAACLVGGVQRLYTEDFDAYRHIDGLEIINPFR